MKVIYIKILICGLLLISGINITVLAQKQFPNKERISYDKDCFTIEGKDVFIFSAAFHYFRCPQELWRERFRKIKEAGFNTVETYIPWNWHERNMPRNINDYSQCDFTDLKKWLKMAHEEFHLYTIVRPGPFICAEWAGGGYPRWIGYYCPSEYKTSFWLRSNHPEHIKWAEHWYNAVCKAVRDEQITNKKTGEAGIIMMQLENEYIYYDMTSVGKEEVLRALALNCQKNNINVPLFTCVTPEVRGSKDKTISQLFDMDNQYVWWNIGEAKTRIESLKKEQSDAPAFVCELQGGWFSTVGGRLSEDSYLDGRHARGMALMAMAGGATGLNYYMFFGGTNIAGWGARRMTTTYDYGAPLKENGAVGEKYYAVKGIGEIIKKFGSKLVRSVPMAIESNDENLLIGGRKASDGTSFVFLLNKDRKNNCNKLISVKFDGVQMDFECNLEPSDSKMIVIDAKKDLVSWYPQKQMETYNNTKYPSAIRIKKVYKRNEAFKGTWRPLKNKSLPELNVNDCRYVMYKSSVNLKKDELKKYSSLIFKTFTEDPVYAEINGKQVKRISGNDLDNIFDVKNHIREGVNDIKVIYENRGHAHGYRPMEELCGIKKGGFGKAQDGVIPLEEWYVKGADKNVDDLLKESCKDKKGWDKILLNRKTIDNLATLQIAGLEKPEWPAAWILQGKMGTAVYKTILNYDEKMKASNMTMLEVGCIDDEGTVWVNEKKVITHSQSDKSLCIDLAPYLVNGKNSIAISVTNESGAGGLLKQVCLKQSNKIYKELQWDVSTNLGGIQAGWNMGNNKYEDWKEYVMDENFPLVRKDKMRIADTDKTVRDGLLAWFSIDFDLSDIKNAETMLWKLRMNASGTGYIWLNGNNIGRYWEEGPQREFYLPECWLNLKGKNSIVLGLRESETNGAKIYGAEIAPYVDNIEFTNK